MPNLFIIDLPGTEISEDDVNLLRHPNVGAVILFSKNFINKEQLQRLTSTIHSIRPDLFIAVDHEGGIVQRFQRHGFRSIPAARVYGEVYDLHPEAGIELARRYGEVMAQDLLSSGVDLSLAPVLDVHGESRVIGQLDRAFHATPEVIVKLSAAFIQGMQKAGMPAIGKHFPGHGSVLSDSHVSKPVLDASLEVLEKRDLKPFKDLIDRNLLAAIMPAHVTYTALDADNPAGFSKIWLQDILRGMLHFDGMVLSDCLGMTGADIGDLHTRAERALKAGCDMLIVCNQSRAILYDLVTSICFEQTEASLHRIQAFKRQMTRFSGEKKEALSPYLPHTLHAATPCGTEGSTENYNKTTSI